MRSAFVVLATSCWIIFVVVPLGRTLFSTFPGGNASTAPLAVAALLMLAYFQWLAVRCFFVTE